MARQSTKYSVFWYHCLRFRYGTVLKSPEKRARWSKVARRARINSKRGYFRAGICKTEKTEKKNFFS